MLHLSLSNLLPRSDGRFVTGREVLRAPHVTSACAIVDFLRWARPRSPSSCAPNRIDDMSFTAYPSQQVPRLDRRQHGQNL